MGNKERPSLAPWISWHEYIVAGDNVTLVYEQQSHWYYLLTKNAAESWRCLFKDDVHDEGYEPLCQLFKDGVFLSSPDSSFLETGDSNNVEKFQKIPEWFHDAIKTEGYIFDAHWDITNKCNERCIHCYSPNAHTGLRNNQVDELSFDEAKQLVDELHYLGVFRLVLSGGEVLTKDYFIPLCEYIRERGFQLIIYTNGIAFTEASLCKLVGLHPATVCFSVYGNVDYIHDSITQVNGSYKKSLFALSYLKKHGIETCHKNTLLTKNYSCWKETLQKGEKLADKSLINCTIYPSMDGGALSTFSLSETQLVDFALSPDSPIYYKRRIKGACSIDKDSSETPCYNKTNTIYINPKGEVCLCIAFPCVIARFRDGNIREIKRSGRSLSFRTDFSKLSNIEKLDNWRSLRIVDLKECGHYDYCDFCIDVCPGDAYLLNGDLLSAPYNHCIIAKARYRANQLSETTM